MKSSPMETGTDNLSFQLERLGYKSRVVSIQRVRELQDEIEGAHTDGSLAEEFFQERLNVFQFGPPDDFPSAESMIVVAIPRPQTPVTFSLNGKTLSLILPPTYAGYSASIREVGDQLNEILLTEGYHVTPGVLPLKILAARSGLTWYGRNNIGYIPGWGSFFQLAGYFTDLPCHEDTWQEPQMLDRCKNCHACMKGCPTGAIVPDRFLLHAERCLVFHNERAASYPFPAWIDPNAHNCLMGCMLCQKICPEDKNFKGLFEEGFHFSPKETALLLQGGPLDRLPAETVKKLEYLELASDVDKMPRNLGIYFKDIDVNRSI